MYFSLTPKSSLCQGLDVNYPLLTHTCVCPNTWLSAAGSLLVDYKAVSVRDLSLVKLALLSLPSLLIYLPRVPGASRLSHHS